MADTYTAVVRKVGAWFVGTCDEIPEITAQGRTQESCLKNLQAAISASLRDRRPKGAGTKEPPAEVRVSLRGHGTRIDRIA